MLDLITALALAFLAGFVVKVVDWIDDERGGRHLSKWLLAMIYGVMLGFLISRASFSTIFLGALFAQVFAGKIDTHAHVLGFVVAAISLFAFGFPDVDTTLFLFFAMLAFIDEVEFGGWLGWLTKHRMFLKVGSLAALFMGRYDYFLGIMAFDLGYTLFDWIAQRYFR